MKKWYNIIVGFFLSLFTIYFVAVNFINIVYYHRMSWSIDLRLLFFNDQFVIFFILTALVVLAWSEVVLNNLFGKTEKEG